MKLGIVGIVARRSARTSSASIRASSWACSATAAHPRAEAPVEAGSPTDESGAVRRRTCSATPRRPGPRSSAKAASNTVCPQLALFDEGINTGCGSATSAAGPFYCPPDQQVYIDLAFFRQLETEFAAQGDFAKAYVIAHEVGHHVQNLLGIADKVHAAQAARVRSRSQCAAGQAWNCRRIASPASGRTTRDSTRQVVEAGDIDEALHRGFRGRRRHHPETRSGPREPGVVHARLRRAAPGVVPQGLRQSGRVQDCNTFQ